MHGGLYTLVCTVAIVVMFRVHTQYSCIIMHADAFTIVVQHFICCVACACVGLRFIHYTEFFLAVLH